MQHFENVYFDFQVSACFQVQVDFMESKKKYFCSVYMCRLFASNLWSALTEILSGILSVIGGAW